MEALIISAIAFAVAAILTIVAAEMQAKTLGIQFDPDAEFED